MIPKIAIISTVINFELYQKTAKCFPNNIVKIVIDGTNGMHGIDSILYMFKKLKNQDIDWIIMADEDVVFENTECGVRDGGVVAHRNFNPYAINTFFSVLNFNEIKNIFDKKEILKNQYCLPHEFIDINVNLPFAFDKSSLYEPYYCFYFWLLRKGKKILYLDSIMEEDQIANAIYFNNKKIATHTWYARGYKKVERHTKRINTYLKNCDNPNFLHFKKYKDKSYGLRKKFKKIVHKLKSICRIK